VKATHRIARVNSSRRGYAGMTVNERPFVAGLIGAFDAAINASDREKAIGVLCEVEINAGQAAQTVDAALANPAKYGYPQPPHVS
jgi:hypothetical protein